MRIRKRWPLTSHLPPLTTSIPDRPSFSAPSDHQNQGQKGISSAVESRGLALHPNGDQDRPTSNLHPMFLMRKRNGWFRTDRGIPSYPKALKGKEEEDGEEDNGEKWVDCEKSSSNMRNANSSSVETAARLMFPPFSSSHQVMGVECEGERVFSFKKKRGGRGEEAMTAAAKEKMTQNRDDDNDDDDDKEIMRESDLKKRGRGNSNASDSVMEGSRCSRVNGRGWRCSQQTLVGYALCEHHLGKGRLRSMSSVRSRSPAVITPIDNVVSDSNNNSQSILSLCKPRDEAMGEEEEKPTMTTAVIMKKKRRKIGVVKARSINSLLDQTHHAT